jgi:hypothetical protein
VCDPLSPLFILSDRGAESHIVAVNREIETSPP